ncbi:CerR family C-terminal domain-containing protein [Profundibacter sp.]
MSNQSRGSTRLALIDAGVRLFGEFGYDATSTRQVAQAADANISAISYYFGGKKGLRLACAEHIAEHLAMAVSGLEKIDDMSPEDAASKLEQVLSEFVHILLEQPQGKEMAQFMLKEVAQVSEVLDLVFPKFIAPVHESVCLLWAKATGQNASNSDVMLTVFSLVGQVIYFRVGQEIVRRRMGWDSVEQTEVFAIQNVIRTNLRATLDVARKGSIQ